MTFARRVLFFVVAWSLSFAALGPARAQQSAAVDLELVLAVDVSLSMDLEEQRLQRDGYVAAFRDPRVIRAIQSGPNGRIAVVYFEWAGIETQAVVIPWTLIGDAASAEAFAARLAEAPISRARMTSVSGALLYAADQLKQSGVSGLRRVVDVSGDGPNNSGPPVTHPREALVKAGVTINGLPIILKQRANSGFFDIAGLGSYYRDCVIGGPGAFIIEIKELAEFATATRQKLLLEISGLMPPGEPPATAWPPTLPPVLRAQFAPGAPSAPVPTDCMIGEKLWRQYMIDRFRE